MEVVEGKKGHVLAVPFPAQGHVKPLLKLCKKFAQYGVKVTFVNIQSIHEKLVAAGKEELEENNIVMVSIPDGLKPGDDPNDTFKLLETLRSSVPDSLTRLVDRINSCNPDQKVSCIIVDVTLEWILEIARNMGVEGLPFSPASGTSMMVSFHIPRLLQDGILDENGSVVKGESFMLSDDIPAWGKDDVIWGFSANSEIQRIFFECATRIGKSVNNTLMLVNTCSELESAACELNPKLLPIGPLLEMDIPKSTSFSYNFHPEDASCLNWLDTKPPGSVLYVSFGSLAVFSQHQFDELALGLEHSGRSFLWVVRLNLANGSQAVYPDCFLDRVKEVGKIVEWAPQEKVLSHPSIGCFLSHCGWNSTLEGLSLGVPFLCWPSFSDQFHNQSYICNKWETGLRIDSGQDGIRSREEIEKKINLVFSLDYFKENALKYKEMCRRSLDKGGSSYRNLERFIDHLRK